MIDKSAIIDPSAKIDLNAKIGSGVKIGAWSIIGSDVEIGAGTTIGPHVIIKGSTIIGDNNTIYQFCSIGEDPQHLNYKGEKTLLIIGNNNIIREFCTLNRGTIPDGEGTLIGNNNFFMAYSHVAHDCQVGDHNIFVNNATLAGHVIIRNYITVGAFVGIHQNCIVHDHSFITGGALLNKDVPPYVMVIGNPATICGLNTVGLKRRGFSAETITMLRRGYNILFRQGLNVKEAQVELEKMVVDCPAIQLFIDSVNNSNRGLVR